VYVLYFDRRWIAVYVYLLSVLVATPYLPLLIKWASSRWQPFSVSRFVLDVEISIGVLLLISGGAVFFFNVRKFPSFILMIIGFIALASLSYFIKPNAYELTHVPQYAILGVLLLHALKRRDGEKGRKASEGPFYFRSAMITGVAGTADELYQGILPLRYFAWYDVALNVLGGLLGLAVFWAFSRK
jgi:hypothetical protein